MEQQTTDKQEQELITIAGGIELEVSYRNNGSASEARETVKVRQIPISKIQSFVFALSNEAEAIELYCDKPKGWADTLSNESASAIADKGQELNLPFFAAWFRRQMKWRESQQLPGSTITDTRAKVAGEKRPSELSSVSASSPPQSPTTTT